MATALAIFVKTPELSPVKTRLAIDIGKNQARAVYDESITAITNTLRLADASLRVHWAVGEATAINHQRWTAFPTLWTGEGGLGERLHHVYTTLQAQYGRVILIGSDSPQIDLATIHTAARMNGTMVIGPATDGGFYLFAADCTIPRQRWCSVTYSRADTLTCLLRQFSDDTLFMLPPLTDIDDKQSLIKVIGELRQTADHSELADRLATLSRKL